MRTYKLTISISVNDKNLGWIIESINEQLEGKEVIHEWDCQPTTEWEDEEDEVHPSFDPVLRNET